MSQSLRLLSSQQLDPHECEGGDNHTGVLQILEEKSEPYESLHVSRASHNWLTSAAISTYSWCLSFLRLHGSRSWHESCSWLTVRWWWWWNVFSYPALILHLSNPSWIRRPSDQGKQDQTSCSSASSTFSISLRLLKLYGFLVENSELHNYNDYNTEERYHWNQGNVFISCWWAIKNWQPIRIHPALMSSSI